MLELRMAKPQEREEICHLWRAVYADEDALMDSFFQACGLEEVMLLKEDGVLRTYIAAPRARLHLPDGQVVDTAYLYALGTDPDQRERGFGRTLLRYADFYLQERKLPCVTLVPAEPSLFRFFESVGYEYAFASRMAEVPAAQIGEAPEGSGYTCAQAEDYNRLREELLAGTFHLEYSQALVEFQRYLSRSTGGELLILQWEGGAGCAAVELQKSNPGITAQVKELLVPPGKEETAMALVAQACPADRYVVRMPVDRTWPAGGYGQPFGVIKWYNQDLRARQGESTRGYLGLAFE